MKFREKWFWALCLAILLHAGFFLIFYLNANKTDTVKTDDKDMGAAKPAAIDSIKLPPSNKIYTTTITTTKSLDDAPDKNLSVNNSKSNNSQTVRSDNVQTVSSQAFKNTANNSKKPTSSTQETTQKPKTPTQEVQSIENQARNIPQPMPANFENNSEQSKNNVGLLDMDVPIQTNNVKLDKTYLSAKSEVENINDHLSAAIIEVKKRNQQKIDERQPFRNEANIQDSQTSIQ